MTKFIQSLIENKTSIIISFAVGILIFYSQPLLTFVGNQIINMFIAVSIKFSNYYYSLIAQNNPNLNIDYIASFIVLLYVYIVGSFLIDKSNLLNKSETKIQAIESHIKGTDNDVKSEKEETPESLLIELQNNLRKMKIVIKMSIVLAMVTFLYLSFQQGIYSQVNAKNISFQNRLTVLAIHLNEDEIKLLKAKWVQMKSVDDYIKITGEISAYENKYHVTK